MSLWKKIVWGLTKWLVLPCLIAAGGYYWFGPYFASHAPDRIKENARDAFASAPKGGGMPEFTSSNEKRSTKYNIPAVTVTVSKAKPEPANDEEPTPRRKRPKKDPDASNDPAPTDEKPANDSTGGGDQEKVDAGPEKSTDTTGGDGN